MIAEYTEGIKAAKDGKELWECPYVMDEHELKQTQCWLAGWMRGKQEVAKGGVWT